MRRLLRVCSYIIKLFFSYLIGFFARVFVSSYRNIWIISERGDDARDNGYFFYKYMIEKHPEQPVRYIIKCKSVDSKKIRPEHRIEPESFKHYLIFAISKVRISSHAWGGDIPYADYYKKLGFDKHSRKKFVFLQHGITKDYLPSLFYPSIRPSIFICGAEPEWRYITQHFKHPQGVVQYTGFARYDSLNEFSVKNQILIMPTFRKYLQGLSDEQFQNEEYYVMWQSLLNMKKLEDMLENNDLVLVFYPHYEMQKYVHLFHNTSKRIKIADFNHYDVQTLLKESRLIITDFSSVFFDFSYMKKPVVFFQFDREQYIQKHYDYTKGYFDYDTMAPGKIVFKPDQLIDEISKIIDCDYVMNEEYKNRRDAFFTISDQHNCDRIFAAIQSI